MAQDIKKLIQRAESILAVDEALEDGTARDLIADLLEVIDPLGNAEVEFFWSYSTPFEWSSGPSHFEASDLEEAEKKARDRHDPSALRSATYCTYGMKATVRLDR